MVHVHENAGPHPVAGAHHTPPHPENPPSMLAVWCHRRADVTYARMLSVGQINLLHNEAGDILQALEATFPRRSAAVPQAKKPADTKPRAGDCAGHTHVGVHVFSNVLACHA
jgi:hypothetical protein